MRRILKGKSKSQYRQREIVVIEKIVYEGVGLARLKSGKVVFVDHVVDGEMVEIELIEEHSDWARGKVLNVVKPSVNRVIPECPVYAQCGGCNLQHISYEHQLKIKLENAQEFFKKWFYPEKIFASPNQFFYRNRLNLQVRGRVGEMKLGFFKKASHHLVEVKNCKIHMPILNEASKILQNVLNRWKVHPYNEIKHTGTLRTLSLRTNPKQNELLVIFVVREGHTFGKKQVAKILSRKLGVKVGVFENTNPKKTNVIFGNKTSHVVGLENMTVNYPKLGISYAVPPLAFFQVNYPVAARMLEITKEFLKEADYVWDLYCGIGFLSLPLEAKILGIDEVNDSIRAAKYMAKSMGKKAIFYTADVAKAAPKFLEKFGKPNAVILDPPRAGVKRETLELILEKIKPKKILYSSCKPSTLRRDLEIITSYGYNVTYMEVLDMFPQTHHFEVVTCLQI